MKHHQNVVSKLEPIRTSGKFRAILGCMLGQKWTDPEIAELYATSDGMLLARMAGDIGANDFIGARADLIRNLQGVARVAGLTAAELRYLLSLAPKGDA